jgi:hypothetical protein
MSADAVPVIPRCERDRPGHSAFCRHSPMRELGVTGEEGDAGRREVCRDARCLGGALRLRSQVHEVLRSDRVDPLH